jgi:DNA invertase Pin-like site-specific DNA recombinase
VSFKSLHDPIDTTNASGRLVFHIMASLAEFERSLLVERTQAGLQAAKKRGKKRGRKFALDPAQIASVRGMAERGIPAVEIAKTLKLGRSTIYRYLADVDQKEAA